MLPAREMEGVWVTAFEESSFVSGATAIPDPDDPIRFADDIELDGERIARRIGIEPWSRHGEAVLLRFVGRRTRDPYLVDCEGVPYRTFVVDRLIEARRLGPMDPLEWPSPEAIRRRPVTVAVRHGGRWGELEAEAVERCKGRGRTSDRNHEPVAADQSPVQARPPGRSSAE
jgi:hypothetical protein